MPPLMIEERQREDFLRAVSHELRTPLNAICGYAQLLMEGIDGPLDPDTFDGARGILDSGRQLSALVGQLLGKFPSQPATADDLRTFLANVSHELRAPLHAILGLSDLLLRGIDSNLSPDQRRSVERINAAGLSLARTLQEVLELAWLETGQLQLLRSNTGLDQVIHSAISELRARMTQTTPIDVQLVDVEKQHLLCVDACRIVQALAYLMIYVAESGCDAPPRISLRASLKSTALEIVVAAQDRVTQDPSEHPGVFDGFQRRPGRTGLGLGPSLARRLVEAHGGTVTSSAKDEATGPGIRFVVMLPLI